MSFAFERRKERLYNHILVCYYYVFDVFCFFILFEIIIIIINALEKIKLKNIWPWYNKNKRGFIPVNVFFTKNNKKKMKI